MINFEPLMRANMFTQFARTLSVPIATLRPLTRQQRIYEAYIDIVILANDGTVRGLVAQAVAEKLYAATGENAKRFRNSDIISAYTVANKVTITNTEADLACRLLGCVKSGSYWATRPDSYVDGASEPVYVPSASYILSSMV